VLPIRLDAIPPHYGVWGGAPEDPRKSQQWYSKYSIFLKDLSALVAFLLLFVVVKTQTFTAAALAMAVNNRMHYLLRLQARNVAAGASCPTDTYSVAESLAHGLQQLFHMSASLLRYRLNCCGAPRLLGLYCCC
jgi:hypothetical protein